MIQLPEVDRVRWKAITGADQFTDPILIRSNEAFMLSVYDAIAWSGNVRLQRSWDNGASWHTVQTYTTVKEDDGVASVSVWVRVGVPSGDYSAGSIAVRLERSGISAS